MRKVLCMSLSIIFMLCMVACAEESPIQQATGATAEQGRAIEEELEKQGIEYEMINEANHNKPAASIPSQYKVYNVIDKNGANYFLVLDENQQMVTLMDSESAVLAGSLPVE